MQQLVVRNLGRLRKLFVFSFQYAIYGISLVFNRFMYNTAKRFSPKTLCCFSAHLPINRIIHIPLADLQYYLTAHPETDYPFLARGFFQRKFIRSGDWDQGKAELFPTYFNHQQKHAVSFRSFYQIIQDDIPYWECDEYKQKIRGENGYFQETEKELQKRYTQLQQMYESIGREGYRSQRKLGNRFQFGVVSKQFDEVRIVIGRDGAYIKLPESANHRLAAAFLHKIDIIPVVVEGVHDQWAKKCYRKHNSSILDAVNAELQSIDQKMVRDKQA